MMFRSRKLLDHARGQDCQVNLPYICNQNSETVVAAHSNFIEHGHAMSIKAHDIFIAFCCSDCHREIDQGSTLTKEEKRFYWTRGHIRTLLIMLEQGILKVK
jgi:hypothetical protein